MVVTPIDTVVTLPNPQQIFNTGSQSLTILQWLDRGGRYVLQVIQYLTRTLSQILYKEQYPTQMKEAYKSCRTLRSLGSGIRVPLSEGDIGGSGGSGSRFRGKIPGSRNACSNQRCSGCGFATYSSKHS